MSKLNEWAKKEVDIVCKENNNCDSDYLNCYKNALKMLDIISNKGKDSLITTYGILTRMLKKKPLSIVYDTYDVWGLIEINEKFKKYQCKRMSSLYKYHYNNGIVKYKDLDRFLCVDIETFSIYENGFVNDFMEDYLGEIEMPYYPPLEPIIVYCTFSLQKDGYMDYDLVAIWKYRNNNFLDNNINKFFKFEDYWIEISKEEWKKLYLKSEGE